MALWGLAQGLVVGALSLVGLGLGALVGSRLGPVFLDEGSRSPYAPLFALVGALVVGGLVAAAGEALGFRVRGRFGQRIGLIDGIGGALLIACVGLLVAWIAGAVALQTPGARNLRGDIQRSKILQKLNETLPPAGPLLNSIARFDPVPEFEGPPTRVRPPAGRIVRDPQVRGAAPSVVRVLGTACGLGVQGSGWIAGDGLVVTNAHVVAGQDDTTVELRGKGPAHDADAVFYDSRNDLAILRSSGIEGTPSLPLAPDPQAGTAGAVLGFPKNGPYDVRPARLGPTSTVTSDDSYGRGPVRRRITGLRGRVRSGNSGGPMVDARGRVITTIFAAAVGSGERLGFGVPNALVAAALRRSDERVDTGPCAR